MNLKEKTRLDIEIKKQLDKLENIYKILNSQNESNYLIDRNRKEGIGDVSSNSSINKLNNRISKKDKKYFLKIINWEELNKLKNDIGKLGEELAFVYEQNRLIDLGLGDYLDKIEHVSKTKGDGLGYDIISIDSDKNPIFIEVKSTTKQIDADIFFSKSEYTQMFHMKNKYFVYRIYNLDIDSKNFEIKTFQGIDSMKEIFDFYSETVRAKAKKGNSSS